VIHISKLDIAAGFIPSTNFAFIRFGKGMQGQGPQLTEERLRTWLDSNQVQRERMCMALLSLNRRYSNIKPRRPKGGPDGGRDIEAVYEDRFEIWGAVGFRNAANDSTEDKRWVRRKFSDDLEAALAENANLKGFVFFTNIDLTPSEEAELIKEAKNRGIISVEIYFRERLRILLDSPEGLGLRYQYLNIPLSEAEQAAFFERFGSQLENLLLKQFDAVDKKLARIEFFHDCIKPLIECGVVLSLKQNYSADNLGHFRILLEVINLLERDPHPTLWIGGRDAYPVWHSGNEQVKLIGTKNLIWSRNPDDKIQDTIIGNGLTTDSIQIFGSLYRRGPFGTMGDFDRKTFSIYITESFFDKINEISLFVNDYVLFSVELNKTNPRNSAPIEAWPEPLSEEERQIPWVILTYSSFNFSDYTPTKVHGDLENR
jgi:hypothetical protein